MGGIKQLRLTLRRLARRHRRIVSAIRYLFVFMATFGAAYGFVRGSVSETAGYDPQAFALGISFLFALACLGLAILSMRIRWLKKNMRKLAAHNEALIDRNWELKEAEERARSLLESQGDLIALRDVQGRLTFVNDTFCRYAGKPRGDLLGSRAVLPVIEQGDETTEPDGSRVHEQKIETAFGPRRIAWREILVRPNANQSAELRCVGRDITGRAESAQVRAASR